MSKEIKQSGLLIPSDLVSKNLRVRLDGLKRDTGVPIKRIHLAALLIGLESKELLKKIK